MTPITIFRGTSGLNTVADPVRIPMTKSGVNDVAEIVNLSIDRYGRPSKRKGWSIIGAGDYHSLFCNGGDCFVASNSGAIFRIGPDNTVTGIRSGMMPQARVSWCQVGEKTYYANGFERGVIIGGVSYVWQPGEYHGPTTNRTFAIPESISHIEEHSGRLFLSEKNILWWSEPFRHDLYNMTDSFVQFHSDIRMVRSVAGGLFIGTDNNTHFISGSLPQEFQISKVAEFPPIEWSDTTEYVDGAEIGLDVSGLCAVWASPEGVIVGTPSGGIVNINKAKVIYPESVSKGFGCLVGYNFIHGMW